MANTNQVIAGGGQSTDVFVNGSIFWGIGSQQPTRFGEAASEAAAQHKAFAAVTAQYLGVNVTSSTTAANVTKWVWRNGGVTGNQVATLTSSVTGWIQDSTHTDSVSVGDLICEAFVGTSASPDCFISKNAVTFNKSSPSTVLSSWYYGASNPPANSTNHFLAPGGLLISTADTNITSRATLESASSLSGFQCNLTTNTTGSSVALRKNGADGNQTLSPATSSAATITQDSTHADTFAAADTTNARFLNAATMALQGFSVTVATTISAQDALVALDATSAQTVTPTNVYSSAVGSTNGVTSSTQNILKLEYAVTASRLRVGCGNNTLTASSAINFNVAGSDVNQTCAFASATTGFVLDSTHTDSVSSGQAMVTHLTGGTSGALTPTIGGVLLDDGTATGGETSTGILTFAGISFTATGTDSHTGTGTLAFSGVGFIAAATDKHTGAGLLTFAGIAFAAAANDTSSTSVLRFSGISFVAAANDVTTSATLTFSGISFDASGGLGASAAGLMAFHGISFAGISKVAHNAVGLLAFSGISIRASVLDFPSAGSGRRSFWTFGA